MDYYTKNGILLFFVFFYFTSIARTLNAYIRARTKYLMVEKTMAQEHSNHQKHLREKNPKKNRKERIFQITLAIEDLKEKGELVIPSTLIEWMVDEWFVTPKTAKEYLTTALRQIEKNDNSR